jgi:hypothetical protein
MSLLEPVQPMHQPFAANVEYTQSRSGCPSVAPASYDVAVAMAANAGPMSLKYVAPAPVSVPLTWPSSVQNFATACEVAQPGDAIEEDAKD